jgi:CobQ-like glutamine amidotransferase family enzyme
VQSIPGAGRAHEAAMTGLLTAAAAATYFALSLLIRSPELPDLIARAQEQAPKRLRPMISMLSGPIVRAAGRGG